MTKFQFFFWLDEKINHRLPDFLFSNALCDYVEELAMETVYNAKEQQRET